MQERKYVDNYKKKLNKYWDAGAVRQTRDWTVCKHDK